MLFNVGTQRDVLSRPRANQGMRTCKRLVGCMFCRVTWERRVSVRPALMAADNTLKDVYSKPDRPDTLPFDGFGTSSMLS